MVCSVTGGGGGGGVHSSGLVSERPSGEAGRDAFEERQSFCLDVQANLYQAVQNQGKTESLTCINYIPSFCYRLNLGKDIPTDRL